MYCLWADVHEFADHSCRVLLQGQCVFNLLNGSTSESSNAGGAIKSSLLLSATDVSKGYFNDWPIY